MDTYITVAGNLTNDPVSRQTASGATVVNFRVASSGRRFDKQQGEWRDGDPFYITVSCWRNLAMNVHSTLRKGDSVVVQGRMTFRSFEDKEGIKRSTHEIDALAVGPDLNRCPVDIRRPNRAGEERDTPAAAVETATTFVSAPGRQPIEASAGSAA